MEQRHFIQTPKDKDMVSMASITNLMNAPSLNWNNRAFLGIATFLWGSYLNFNLLLIDKGKLLC